MYERIGVCTLSGCSTTYCWRRVSGHQPRHVFGVGGEFRQSQQTLRRIRVLEPGLTRENFVQQEMDYEASAPQKVLRSPRFMSGRVSVAWIARTHRARWTRKFLRSQDTADAPVVLLHVFDHDLHGIGAAAADARSFACQRGD